MGRARGDRPLLAIRLPNWLGDVVLAMRAVDALVARFPEHDVRLIARPWAPALWGAHWPRAHWHEAPGAGGRWLPAVPALARAAARSIVIFPPSLSARLHAFVAGVPQRIGLAEEEGGFLLTHSAPRGPRGSRHLEDEYLDLVRGLGAEPQPRRALVPPPGAAEAARRALAAAGADLSAGLAGPRLVVAPGARYGPAKRWPAERFAAVAEAWAATCPVPSAAHVLLVGGREDAAEVAAVRAASAAGPHRTLALAGATDLAALAGLVASADAILANDSGVAHLAAALGRPTVVVFGSTNPHWTAPRGPAVRVLVEAPPCAPCHRPRCEIADRYRCLRAVTIEDATGALRAARGDAAAAASRPDSGEVAR